MNLPNWLSWLRPAPATEPVKNGTPIQMGIVKSGSHLLICAPFSQRRGVQIVTVTESFLRDYNRVMTDYADVQDQLKALPKSLRPRKRSVRGSTKQEGDTNE